MYCFSTSLSYRWASCHSREHDQSEYVRDESWSWLDPNEGSTQFCLIVPREQMAWEWYFELGCATSEEERMSSHSLHVISLQEQEDELWKLQEQLEVV